MPLFQGLSHKLNLLWLSVLLLPFLSEGVIYQDSINIDDLTSLFGDEECIEGSLSVTENGDPIIKSGTFVSSVGLPPQVSITKSNKNNDTASERSAMSLVYELAEFNKIGVQFTLTDEKGPAHKKQFVISLRLGEEEYVGEGTSIKKAQHEASKLALNSTLYSHPPKRIKSNIVVENKKSPVEKLDEWARKHNGALVTYSFFEQSQLMDEGSHTNYYHSGMYSNAKNIYKATVTIANQAYSGEGSCLESAKQFAAKKALESLQRVDGFCMLTDKEKSIFKKVFDSDSSDNNPISLVHEFGTMSNMPVSFDLYSEEGPPHIKKFVFRCNVGDSFESFGESSSKKGAKKEAAEKMIQQLKRHATFNNINCVQTPKRNKTKKKKSRNLIKSVSKSYSEEEDEEKYNADLIPDELDPISKLFHIQQAKHEVLPVFTLLEKSNKEFSMEVVVNKLTAIGTGANKKAAKKNAAQAMLEKLGYSSVHKTDHNVSLKKRKDFSDGTSSKKYIAPGLNLNSNKLNGNQNQRSKKSEPQGENKKPRKLKHELGNDRQSKESRPERDTSDSKSNTMKSESGKKSDLRPKSQLINLSQQMNFKFQFSDYPKANNSGFVSLISVTTDPPKVCYGVGETTDRAQDKAALSALGSLYKAQIDHMSRILQHGNSASPVKTEITFIEEDNVVRSTFGGETE